MLYLKKRETYTCKVAISLNSRKRRTDQRNRESQSEREGCKKNLFWATRQRRAESVQRSRERAGERKKKVYRRFLPFCSRFLLRFLRECAIHAHTQTQLTQMRTHELTNVRDRVTHEVHTRRNRFNPRPFVKVALFNSSSFH